MASNSTPVKFVDALMTISIALVKVIAPKLLNAGLVITKLAVGAVGAIGVVEVLTLICDSILTQIDDLKTADGYTLSVKKYCETLKELVNSGSIYGVLLFLILLSSCFTVFGVFLFKIYIVKTLRVS